MSKVGIFYGSTTGNTETVSEKLQESLVKKGFEVDLFNVDDSKIDDLTDYTNLVFGIPTWDIGELQEDWEDFIKEIEENADLEGKKIGFFGVGDQEGYPDTFGDAIGVLHTVVLKKNGQPVADKWPTNEYNFEESKGVKNGLFVGMMCDEDNESEKTDDRVERFAKLLADAFK